MEKFNNMTDEQLGAYLDGMLSDKDSAMVDAAMDIDTYEILQVSSKAVEEMPSDKKVSLPSWLWGSVASVCASCGPPDAMDFMNEASIDDDNDDE